MKKTKRLRIGMPEAEYRRHVNDSDGVCLACGAIRYGDTEPDAEGYHCDDCEADAVQGIENAMMAGNVVIT